MSPEPSRRFGAPVRGHRLRLAPRSLQSCRLPSPRRFQLDIAQPPQRGCFRSKRHWCSPHGHPLRGGLVHQLHCPRGKVHRLRDAADSGSSPLLWLPVQERPFRRLLSIIECSVGSRVCPLFVADCLPWLFIQQMVFAAKQVRFAPLPIVIDSSGVFSDTFAVSRTVQYTVRTAYVRTPVCDHSFPRTCLFIS